MSQGNGTPMNGLGTGPFPPGLGDIAPSSVDPMERYFQILRGQVTLPRRGWIVQPKWMPPFVPGMEKFQEIFENHELPRQWQLLEDFFILLQRGRFLTKGPNWIEPPITAEMQDLVSEVEVALDTTDATVVTYTVPDRCVACFQTFGHGLSLAAQWGTVIWTIDINQKPVRTYHDFRLQRGTIVQPTPFPKPITLKGRDVLRVRARRGATAVSATARIQGYVIAAETVTQDGSYKDWNSR